MYEWQDMNFKIDRNFPEKLFVYKETVHSQPQDRLPNVGKQKKKLNSIYMVNHGELEWSLNKKVFAFGLFVDNS